MKTNQIENPDYNAILDKESIQTLFITCNQMNKKMNQHLLKFAHNLTNQYRDVTNIDKLNEWINIIMKLRVASSQGIESFYEIICENNHFEESKKAIESFLSWSQFYEQVVKKVQISLNNNNLFKCSFLINVFDDQIEELKKTS